ncbi:MAG: phage scaffolding protein [Psychrobacillus psychrodurans]
MKKEELVALGLTPEQVDSVINGFGTMVPKSRLDDKIQEAKDYKSQLDARDKQLAELEPKAAGNEALLQQIQKLQEENKDAQTEYEKKLAETQRTFALDSALSGAKVKNLKAVKALLDADKIKLDGDKLSGLDEQLEALKTSDAYLFEAAEEKKPTFSTKPMPKGDKFTKEEIMAIKDSSQRIQAIQDNPDLFN